jgi:hypothetical protein
MESRRLRRGAVDDGAARIDRPYRYSLWRRVGESRRRVLFVMLNPSTADAIVDDPTIRRCMGFARTWGFGELEVCNLFAYRSPCPSALLRPADPDVRKSSARLRQVTQKN